MKKHYPSSGDDGRCQLASGQWVEKNHPTLHAMGVLDELNSIVGWARCACNVPELSEWLEQIQRDLFELGSSISGWSGKRFPVEPIRRLEHQIQMMQKAVSNIHGFILPNGCESAARLHIARTLCRRTERTVVSSDTGENVMPFINRLGDWFYLAACWASSKAGQKETLVNKGHVEDKK